MNKLKWREVTEDDFFVFLALYIYTGQCKYSEINQYWSRKPFDVAEYAQSGSKRDIVAMDVLRNQAFVALPISENGTSMTKEALPLQIRSGWISDKKRKL